MATLRDVAPNAKPNGTQIAQADDVPSALARRRAALAEAAKDTDVGVRAKPAAEATPEPQGSSFTSLKRGPNESMKDFAARQSAADKAKYGGR